MESKKPLLSICIPTYNRVKYLNECINSILDQKPFIKNMNFEIIISDNASTDNTNNIIKKYLKKYNFIKYFRNEANFGPEGNFIELIRKSSGTYIWLFGDDELYNTKNSINGILLLLKNKKYDLIIMENSIKKRLYFKNYKKVVKYFAKNNNEFILNHTLITCNIFKKSIFNYKDGFDYTYTHYIHMYGIMRSLLNKGSILIIPNNFFLVRSIRADMHIKLNTLWIIQTKYFYYIGTIYNSFYTKYIMSFKFFIRKSIIEILIYIFPLTFLSKVKKLITFKT